MSVKMKRGQIWIETVVYTLIGLTIMGLILAFVKPAVEQRKDKAILEQSISTLEFIESQISEIEYYGAGNSRIIDLGIKKGEFQIFPENDTMRFKIKSKHLYSEENVKVRVNNVNVITEKKSGEYEVSMWIDYSGKVDITSENNPMIFSEAKTPYKLQIENKGTNNSITNIHISNK